MLFLSSRRVTVSRGLFLCGAGLIGIKAQAQQLSAPTPYNLGAPTASSLEPDSSTPPPPQFPSVGRLRATKPALSVRPLRSLTISAPPDGFYQTSAQLEGWMFDLAKIRPAQVKTRVLGKTPGGRRLVALEVVPAGVTPWKMRRLVVICRQHGNEPEASASGMRFIREFLTTTDPKKKRIAARTALLIVPIANPDGAAVYRRRTDKNVDMNRDWGHNKASEIKMLTTWIGAWKPRMVIDVHQWLPFEKMPPPMAEASGGALAKKTAQLMAQNNASRGYWLAARSRWGLDSLCHRYWGQRFQIPAILLETRHRPTVPGARDVAIGTSLTALWSAAETIQK